MTAIRLFLALAFACLASAAGAQTYSPAVTMTITAPDGTSHEVVAHDSNVGRLKLKDGSEFQFRPTVHDEPFSKVTVGIFTADSTLLGEVQLVKGAAAIDSKTKPAFKIAVKAIELPKKTS